MRLRKLGQGQSVIFCIPDEIERNMTAKKPRTADLCVADVLKWAIGETCIDLRRKIPLWSIQGQRYDHQQSVRERFGGRNADLTQGLAAEFLEPESKSLDQRYRPSSRSGLTSTAMETVSGNLRLIAERCKQFETSDQGAALQEEQERELAPENEQERQIERPAPAKPLAHSIHSDLLHLLSTGQVRQGSVAFVPAFQTLKSTSAGKHFDAIEFPGLLLATGDFAQTVKRAGDAFQRPVQWLLSVNGGSAGAKATAAHLICISPYEADRLLPEIKESKHVHLHLYAPRSNPGLRALDGLDLFTVPSTPAGYSIPADMIVQLNIFAGQTHLSNYEEYTKICEFLDLAPAGLQASTKGEKYSGSPVKFVETLHTTIRRDSGRIDKTHMGKILDHQVLDAETFSGPQSNNHERLENGE